MPELIFRSPECCQILQLRFEAGIRGLTQVCAMSGLTPNLSLESQLENLMDRLSNPLLALFSSRATAEADRVDLNLQVDGERQLPEDVAAAYLEEQGLIGG